MARSPHENGGDAFDRPDGDRPRGGRTGGLAPVPTGLADQVPLDGPVELEGPLGPIDFSRDPVLEAVAGPGLDPLLDGVSDLEDTESERGGIFRARELRRHGDRDQHQQAADPIAEPDGVRELRPDGVRPLPRRKPPTLVADRGRRIDEAGRAHPTATDPEATTRPASGPVRYAETRLNNGFRPRTERATPPAATPPVPAAPLTGTRPDRRARCRDDRRAAPQGPPGQPRPAAPRGIRGAHGRAGPGGERGGHRARRG